MARTKKLDIKGTKKVIWDLYNKVLNKQVDISTAKCLGALCKTLLYANQLENIEARSNIEKEALEAMEKLNEQLNKHDNLKG